MEGDRVFSGDDREAEFNGRWFFKISLKWIDTNLSLDHQRKSNEHKEGSHLLIISICELTEQLQFSLHFELLSINHSDRFQSTLSLRRKFHPNYTDVCE